MATKTMLYALSQVHAWHGTPAGKAAKVPEPLRGLVADAVAQGAAMLAKAGKPRSAATGTGAQGRPPSTAYAVEISGYDPFTVMGGNGAANAVNKHMELLGEKRRFTANNLSVSIARNGGWFHNVETTNGTVTIAVRKIESGT